MRPGGVAGRRIQGHRPFARGRSPDSSPDGRGDHDAPHESFDLHAPQPPGPHEHGEAKALELRHRGRCRHSLVEDLELGDSDHHVAARRRRRSTRHAGELSRPDHAAQRMAVGDRDERMARRSPSGGQRCRLVQRRGRREPIRHRSEPPGGEVSGHHSVGLGGGGLSPSPPRQQNRQREQHRLRGRDGHGGESRGLDRDHGASHRGGTIDAICGGHAASVGERQDHGPGGPRWNRNEVGGQEREVRVEHGGQHRVTRAHRVHRLEEKARRRRRRRRCRRTEHDAGDAMASGHGRRDLFGRLGSEHGAGGRVDGDHAPYPRRRGDAGADEPDHGDRRRSRVDRSVHTVARQVADSEDDGDDRGGEKPLRRAQRCPHASARRSDLHGGEHRRCPESRMKAT